MRPCAICMSGTYRGQEEVSDLLELELYLVMSLQEGIRIEHGSSVRAASALIH